MFSLLESRNFGKITVSDICMEALISRATFYSHFIDKYDLLRDWLICLKMDNMTEFASYEQVEESVNRFVEKNSLVIKNLIYEANDETMTILFESILATLDLNVESIKDKKMNTKFVVLSNFYAGGILYYILWHVKNKFPPDVMPMNTYFYEIIEKFQGWKNDILFDTSDKSVN